jgi:hypothetical protein
MFLDMMNLYLIENCVKKTDKTEFSNESAKQSLIMHIVFVLIVTYATIFCPGVKPKMIWSILFDPRVHFHAK